MRANAIFFLLRCGAKPQNYDLVLTCFFLSCNLGAMRLSYVPFHMESEKHAVSSPLLKFPGVSKVSEKADPTENFKDDTDQSKHPHFVRIKL